ncbi:MAG: Unknown protein [uncultured Sulfurovum sp.]|uniref:Colicin V production protein n=1 Tax=uncultured Sulfurovum sp. TaxID=269237 RepID=A0A6S6SYN7_9BACT|nr:MAG: Unknown protein [uncultured Sulfurovum sp.]
MEFMGFHIIDIIIVALVAFLAIKGLLNGFSKELLSFISIVAGVILAARYNMLIIEFINEQKLFPAIPEEFAKLIGFILIVIGIWLVIAFISSIVSRLTSPASSFISRLLGYLLSAARYVFIFSLIIFGVSQSDFFKKSATKFKAETELFEPMSQLGAKILNIDLNQTIVEDDNTSQTKEINTTEVNLSIKPITALVEQNASN